VSRSARQPGVSQSRPHPLWPVEVLLRNRFKDMAARHNHSTSTQLRVSHLASTTGRNCHSHSFSSCSRSPSSRDGRKQRFCVGCTRSAAKNVNCIDSVAFVCAFRRSAKDSLSAAAFGSGDWPTPGECAQSPAKCGEKLGGQSGAGMSREVVELSGCSFTLPGSFSEMVAGTGPSAESNQPS
jgi:hypothetical protein